MSKEHLTPLGCHAYLATYATYDAQKNLYDLSLNYFRDSVASLQANTHTVMRTVTKGCPQVSCCGPGFWNLMYNAFLNFSSHTKVNALQMTSLS